MRYPIGFGLLAACLVLSGCAASSDRYSGGDAGVLVLSIAQDKDTRFSIYRLNYRSRDGRISDAIAWMKESPLSSDTPDFSEPSKSGEVFALKLAPGDYEIFNYTIVGDGARHSVSEDFSIPFTIKAHETIYLGEFLGVVTHGGNISASPEQRAPIFVISDQIARDAAIAAREEPDIQATRDMVPPAKALRPPLFRTVPSNY